MIKKCLKFVMIALCLCHMQSCSRINHINNTLSKVDFILDKDPKTALEKLDSIDQEMLVTRKMKARYALLRSISLDKNFIDLTTDTLIAPAVKYYNNHGSSDDKLKTLYYLGRIQYNAGNYNQEEVDEIYCDICKLAVLSGIEIDKAKRSYGTVETQKELDKLSEHYGKVRPKFFREIDEEEIERQVRKIWDKNKAKQKQSL